MKLLYYLVTIIIIVAIWFLIGYIYDVIIFFISRFPGNPRPTGKSHLYFIFLFPGPIPLRSPSYYKGQPGISSAAPAAPRYRMIGK